jgi:hypothetical protein
MKLSVFFLALFFVVLAQPAFSDDTLTQRVYRTRTGGSMMSNVKIEASPVAGESSGNTETSPAVPQDARAMLMSTGPAEEMPKHTIHIYRSRTGGRDTANYRIINRTE